jgi:ABC-type Na+ efflux pump permease subunit
MDALSAGLRFAIVLCLKDLRQRLRDRTAILVAVVVPLLLEEISSAEAAGEALADDDVDAALVLRPGFASKAASPGELPPAMEVLASGGNPFATRMVVGLAERFLAEGRGEHDIPSIVPISPGGKLRPVDFYAFSMTVLFLTFTVLSGVRSLQEEVDAGVLARLVASPASARSILGGKLLGLLLLGWLQMAVMILSTSLLFGTPWGNPVAVACLVFTSVWMAIGMTSFFMAIARNAEQGQMVASISIFLLAVIGGQFMPAQGLPDVFDTLQRLTPNGQAARGFMDAAAMHGAGSVTSLLEPLLFTFVVGSAGIFFAARRATAAIARSV